MFDQNVLLLVLVLIILIVFVCRTKKQKESFSFSDPPAGAAAAAAAAGSVGDGPLGGAAGSVGDGPLGGGAAAGSVGNGPLGGGAVAGNNKFYSNQLCIGDKFYDDMSDKTIYDNVASPSYQCKETINKNIKGNTNIMNYESNLKKAIGTLNFKETTYFNNTLSDLLELEEDGVLKTHLNKGLLNLEENGVFNTHLNRELFEHLHATMRIIIKPIDFKKNILNKYLNNNIFNYIKENLNNLIETTQVVGLEKLYTDNSLNTRDIIIPLDRIISFINNKSESFDKNHKEIKYTKTELDTLKKKAKEIKKFYNTITNIIPTIGVLFKAKRSRCNHCETHEIDPKCECYIYQDEILKKRQFGDLKGPSGEQQAAAAEAQQAAAAAAPPAAAAEAQQAAEAEARQAAEAEARQAAEAEAEARQAAEAEQIAAGQQSSASLQQESRIAKMEEDIKEYEHQIQRMDMEKRRQRELKEKSLKLELLKKQKEIEQQHKNLNPMSSEEKDRLLLSQSYNNYALFPHSINHKPISELQKTVKLNRFSLTNFDFDEESVLTNEDNSNFKGMVNELCQKYSEF